MKASERATWQQLEDECRAALEHGASFPSDKVRHAWWHSKAIALKDDLTAAQAKNERLRSELEALQAGARTGMLKYMLAGDVGCFADRIKNLLQAKDWDGMRLTITDFFNLAHDETEKGRIELDRLEKELEREKYAVRTLAESTSSLLKRAEAAEAALRSVDKGKDGGNG